MDSVYRVEQLSADIWSINERAGRCFLLTGERRALLVDTGYGGGNLAEVVAGLTDKPVSVVNTHADIDHIRANAQFSEIYMHLSEFDRYYSKETSPKPPHVIWEGDLVDLGGLKLEIILTPGHTPGSICLLESERKFLIGGDNIQTSNVYMFGQGRNIFAYIESMRKLRSLSTQFDKIFSSHGEPIVGKSVLEDVLNGAILLAAGKLPPQPAPDELPCMLYKYNQTQLTRRASAYSSSFGMFFPGS